jgi:hypothetical protein
MDDLAPGAQRDRKPRPCGRQRSIAEHCDDRRPPGARLPPAPDRPSRGRSPAHVVARVASLPPLAASCTSRGREHRTLLRHGSIAGGTAGGAAIGAGLGVAIGAIAGAFVGAADTGAAMGAALGGVTGAAQGAGAAAQGVDEQRLTAYRNCMVARGYAVGWICGSAKRSVRQHLVLCEQRAAPGRDPPCGGDGIAGRASERGDTASATP